MTILVKPSRDRWHAQLAFAFNYLGPGEQPR